MDEIEKLQRKLTPKPDFSKEKLSWMEKVIDLIMEIVKEGEKREAMVTTVGNKIGIKGKLFHSRSTWFERDGIRVFPGIVKMIEDGEVGFRTMRDFAINSLPENHELRRELREIEMKEKEALKQWRKENAEILERIREVVEDW